MSAGCLHRDLLPASQLASCLAIKATSVRLGRVEACSGSMPGSTGSSGATRRICAGWDGKVAIRDDEFSNCEGSAPPCFIDIFRSSAEIGAVVQKAAIDRMASTAPEGPASAADVSRLQGNRDCRCRFSADGGHPESTSPATSFPFVGASTTAPPDEGDRQLHDRSAGGCAS